MLGTAKKLPKKIKRNRLVEGIFIGIISSFIVGFILIFVTHTLITIPSKIDKRIRDLDSRLIKLEMIIRSLQSSGLKRIDDRTINLENKLNKIEGTIEALKTSSKRSSILFVDRPFEYILEELYKEEGREVKDETQ